MSLWFIALPCVFGAVILLSILVCCFCPCSPEKATQRENEHVVQVLEVVRYPEGSNNSSSTEEARNGVVTAGDGVPTSRPRNEPHAAGQRYYYPLQVEEQRPVTAAVAGSARTRAAEPFVGSVVADAGLVATANVPNASGAVRATRHARNSVGYGEAVYVSREDESNKPTLQHLKEGHQ